MNARIFSPRGSDRVRPYSDPIPTLLRPYSDPTPTLLRPYSDPTPTLINDDLRPPGAACPDTAGDRRGRDRRTARRRTPASWNAVRSRPRPGSPSNNLAAARACP